jgi:hypothetical protein
MPKADETGKLLDTPARTKSIALNYEEALEKLGGFGIFQWYAVLVFSLNYMTGGMIVFGLPFLETTP